MNDNEAPTQSENRRDKTWLCLHRYKFPLNLLVLATGVVSYNADSDLRRVPALQRRAAISSSASTSASSARGLGIPTKELSLASEEDSERR